MILSWKRLHVSQEPAHSGQNLFSFFPESILTHLRVMGLEESNYLKIVQEKTHIFWSQQIIVST